MVRASRIRARVHAPWHARTALPTGDCLIDPPRRTRQASPCVAACSKMERTDLHRRQSLGAAGLSGAARAGGAGTDTGAERAHDEPCAQNRRKREQPSSPGLPPPSKPRASRAAGAPPQPSAAGGGGRASAAGADTESAVPGVAVGKRVEVYWGSERTWYSGVVAAVSGSRVRPGATL